MKEFTINTEYTRSIYERYYTFFYRLFNFKKINCIVPIDFNKSWQQLIFKQPARIAYTIIPLLIVRTFGTLTPMIVGYILCAQRMDYFALFIVVWGVLIGLNYFSDFNFTKLLLSTQSIQYHANQLLLTADPILHANRATGKIIAKIERAVRAYREVLEIGIHDLLSTLIGTVTALVVVIHANLILGYIAIGCIAIIIVFACIFYIVNNRSFLPHYIAAEDTLKNTGLENLAQITLIRSTFAGNEANRRLRHQTQASIAIERASLSSFYLMNSFMRLMYFAMFFIVMGYMLILAHQNTITVLSATTLLITFFRGTYDITKIGRRIYWFISCIDQIEDLFVYLRDFGHPTFPVLGDRNFELPLNKEGNIVIKAANLRFRYNTNAQIFNDHSLLLTIVPSQKNKLYGIIGPSGMGKTTLLSILGGQLKPQDGTITINGINIYSFDDYARRRLIAIQNQTASMLRGSVRFNLLFGLPQDKILYTDTELQTVLERVGLWSLFDTRNGLETFIGESGFTLSGGQRQRFNFASLYLRAKYYKPLLILMDEPTSSLDEVSELAITTMISELAVQSVVFVIAHRLHTLENATGLLDISLMKETKKMRFYSPELLAEKSTYYRSLLVGEGIIDA